MKSLHSTAGSTIVQGTLYCGDICHSHHAFLSYDKPPMACEAVYILLRSEVGFSCCSTVFVHKIEYVCNHMQQHTLDISS